MLELFNILGLLYFIILPIFLLTFGIFISIKYKLPKFIRYIYIGLLVILAIALVYISMSIYQENKRFESGVKQGMQKNLTFDQK
jgi:hypothetical protein